jgi:MFS transporter, PAT family, beta-lactamase induction signal transducer AmpG
MPKSRNLRYLLFALLYFTQGTILSYFTALNALYFLSQGLTMASVGIFSAIALLPFIIKIFLGMLSDNVNLFGMGHRKPYILIGLAVQFFCLLAVPFIDLKSGYWGFVALAFVLQMGMALYDTCTDGLALDTTPLEEQGTIQGFMVGGRAVGVIAIASVVGWLAQNVSWLAVFWLLAGLTLLPLPLVLSLRETGRPAGQRFEWSAFGAFKQVPIIALAGVGLVAFLVVVGANQLVNPFLEKQFSIDLTTAGLFTTVWGIGVVVGGLLGGYLNDKIGRGRAVLAALGFSSAAILALGLVNSPQLAWPLVLIFGLAYGTYQTVYFALAMHYTDRRVAASMFAILMAFTNLGQAIGLGFGGVLAEKSGYLVTFAIFAAINLLALPLLPVVFRAKGLRLAK